MGLLEDLLLEINIRAHEGKTQFILSNIRNNKLMILCFTKTVAVEANNTTELLPYTLMKGKCVPTKYFSPFSECI